MKIKITEIHPNSVFFSRQGKYVGKEFETKDKPEPKKNNYFWCDLSGDIMLDEYFMWCKYIEVPEPSAMSELGTPYCRTQIPVTQGALDQISTWINENMPAPKKLSWWQKIQKYDDLQARCNSAESMRDHYKTIMTEALRDRDASNKIIDNWERVAIERGKRADEYCETLEMISFAIDSLFKKMAE